MWEWLPPVNDRTDLWEMVVQPMPLEKVNLEPDTSPDDDSHYHFRVSLRIRHPCTDPKYFTDVLGMKPNRAWKAGERRQTPMGEPLQGKYPTTYWYAVVLAGRHRYPDPDLSTGIRQVLDQLVMYRGFFHALRFEGGSAELFIGWFFERQSGEVFTYETLAKAADLKIDLSFDVYPPTQP